MYRAPFVFVIMNQMTWYLFFRSTLTNVTEEKGKAKTHWAPVGLKTSPPEAEGQQEFRHNKAGIPIPRYRHEVPNRDHERNVVRAFVVYEP